MPARKLAVIAAAGVTAFGIGAQYAPAASVRCQTNVSAISIGDMFEMQMLINQGFPVNVLEAHFRGCDQPPGHGPPGPPPPQSGLSVVSTGAVFADGVNM
jgi:hypothetical protein